jgi:RNA polymerase sigma-70 factor (ECF subfamily)
MPFRKPSRPAPPADAPTPQQRDAAPLGSITPGGDPGDFDPEGFPDLDPELPLPGEDDALEPEQSDELTKNDDDAPQRFAGSGVHQDMAAAAVHPGTVGPGIVGSGTRGSGSRAGAPGFRESVRTDASRARGSAAQAPALPAGGWGELTDAEIMLRVAAGDEAGFGILVEKYRRQMVHYMFRMVHNQAVAEELAQEVFLRVYRARASYRAEAKFSTWLYRIATNLGVNHARDTRLERTAPAVYLDQADAETGMTPDVADSTPTAEQQMLREEGLAAIRKHVMALPERQRTAVLMHKYQDLDYKQIGAVLKLSESATKSLLFRAYQTLRERLQEFI